MITLLIAVGCTSTDQWWHNEDANPYVFEDGGESESEGESDSESESESEGKVVANGDKTYNNQYEDLEKGTLRVQGKSIGIEMVGGAIEYLNVDQNMSKSNLRELQKNNDKVSVSFNDIEDDEKDGESDDEQVEEELNTSAEEVVDVEMKKKQWATMYKVSDLKDMAESKGLANYQKLKKNDLIELIINSE